MKRYCFALDLKDDPELIAAYKEHHKKVWSSITKSIRAAGILELEIYCIANRLFMMMEVDDTFSLERKQQMDAQNIEVQKWETLMWQYQQALPTAKPKEKWLLMQQIYKL